jgi:hypothetical protein
LNKELARQALERGVCLELQYDGFVRVVEVHAVGSSKAGFTIMRVWQLSGGSAHAESTGWKLMRLDDATCVSLTALESQAPRPGYKKGDRAMSRVLCEV